MAVSRGWKSPKSGKEWTKKQRNDSYEQTKIMIREGSIPDAKLVGCERCGQKDGIIHYHNHDYDSPYKYLEALCWRCHLMLHSEKRNPKAVERYFEEIASGKQYPPVYRNDLGILSREHGV